MLTEADIERAARVIIDKHGSNAVRVAECRISHLSHDGQAEAAATWRRVQQVICLVLADEVEAAAD